MLSSCSDSTEPKQSEVSSTANSLQPEMIVVPVQGKFLVGCLTEDLLNELLLHSINKEKTKFEAMFASQDCIQIPENQIYKLLSVNRTTVEFTHIDSNKSVGMWAVIEAFQPKK